MLALWRHLSYGQRMIFLDIISFDRAQLLHGICGMLHEWQNEAEIEVAHGSEVAYHPISVI